MKSAIKEVEEQLFLDTADGNRLSVISDNLGFERPAFGFNNDAEWRALVKNLALEPKNIELPFRRILEICLGPQTSRVAVLSADTAVGDTIVTVDDASTLVQLGTLVFDPGLATEEIVNYDFIDYKNNQIYLSSALTMAHRSRTYAATTLVDDAAIGATSIIVYDSSLLPDADFPYPLHLGKGTSEEEVVSVTANNTATNTLTVSPLSKAHKGFEVEFVRKELVAQAPAGRVFVQLDIADTEEFPFEGWIRLSEGTAAEEIVYFDENSVDDNVLYLKTPLKNTHASGASVELLTAGALTEVISVVQLGVGWDIFHTEPKHVQVLIPKNLKNIRLIDASYLHGDVPDPVATTLATETAVEDTELALASTTGFPSAGLLQINGSEIVFYTSLDSDAATVTLTQEIGAVYPVGTSVTLYRLPYASTDLEEGNLRDLSGSLIDSRFAGPYLYDYNYRGPTTRKATLQLVLPPPTNIARSQLPGRTSLEVEDASLYTSLSLPFSVRVGRESGFLEDTTVTDVTLAGSANDSLLSPASVGDTTLSLASSVDFPESSVANVSDYQIVIDKDTLQEEIVIVKNNDSGSGTLLVSALTKSHSAGATVSLVNDVLTVDPLEKPHFALRLFPTRAAHKVEYLVEELPLNSTATFPNSGSVIVNFGDEKHSTRSRIVDIISPTVYELRDTSEFPTKDFPYQVIVGEGRPNEERLEVTANDTVNNQITFSSPPIFPHSTGPAAQATGSITTVPGANIVDGETFKIDDGVNFAVIFEFDLSGDGVNEDNVEIILTSFSTADEVRDAIIEAVNNTPNLNITASIGGPALVTLTHMSATAVGNVALQESVADAGFVVDGMAGGSASFGEYVSFVTGREEVLDYQDIDGNSLIFDPPQVMGKHILGESVVLTLSASAPTTDGSSYPFYLPPDLFMCMRVMFDRVRAAKVKVSITEIS